MAREQILVVEDEEDIQQLVSFNLIKAGYHVLCAERRCRTICPGRF